MINKNKFLIFIFFTFIILYFLGFGLIFASTKSYVNISSYTDEILKALLAAGTVAILTSIIFIFQSSIEEKNKKKEEVFRIKLEFYSEIINSIEIIEEDGEVDAEELNKLFFLIFRSVMFANPDVIDALNNYLSLVEDNSKDKTTKNKNRFEEIVKITKAARKDLEVQDEIPTDMIPEFDSKIDKISLKAEEFSKAKKIYRSNDEKRKIIKEYDEYGDNKSAWLKEAYNLTPAYIYTWKKQLNMNEQN